jgi:hypothetical protein
MRPARNEEAAMNGPLRIAKSAWRRIRRSGKLAILRERLERNFYRLAGRSLWKITNGQRTASQKIATFVLFQPDGVAPSTLMTCEYLCKHDFSTLVISNARLSESDRNELALRSWKVIERPNFGYDFGAYRDGIAFVRSEGITPDHMLLMNDSTWFPLSMNSPSLSHVIEAKDPFYGLLFKSENIKIHGPARDHMESHFLSFKRAALESDAFTGFWNSYLMTSSRYATIQDGEKGITVAMSKAGFSTNGMLSHGLLLKHFETKTNAELRKILEDMVCHRESEISKNAAMLLAYDDSSEWRSAALAHFGECLESMEYFINTAFVSIAIKELGLPFLKKSKERRFELAREFVANRLADDPDFDFDPQVMAEIRASIGN